MHRDEHVRGAALAALWLCSAATLARAQATNPSHANEGEELVPAPPPAAAAPNPAQTPIAPTPSAAPPPSAASAPPSSSAPASNVPESVIEFPQPVTPLPRTHGFYLREQLGIAAWHARFAPDTNRSHLSAGLDEATAVGFSLAPGVVLFAELIGTGGGYNHTSAAYVVATYSLGPGVAYLWLDQGFYVSGTIAPALGVRIYKYKAQSQFEHDETRAHFTSLGVSFNATAGKEWQISDLPLGLGVAFFVRYAVLAQGNFDAFGVSASLTYY